MGPGGCAPGSYQSHVDSEWACNRPSPHMPFTSNRKKKRKIKADNLIERAPGREVYLVGICQLSEASFQIMEVLLSLQNKPGKTKSFSKTTLTAPASPVQNTRVHVGTPAHSHPHTHSHLLVTAPPQSNLFSFPGHLPRRKEASLWMPLKCLQIMLTNVWGDPLPCGW